MVNELITTDTIRKLINIDIMKSEIGIKINIFNKEKYSIKVIPIKQRNNPIYNLSLSFMQCFFYVC